MLRLLPSPPPHSSPGRPDELSGLARRAIEGDPQAERTLTAALVPSLVHVVRRVLGSHHPDVEDVVFEAMGNVLQGLLDFRFESSVKHFACRVAVLTAVSARRRAVAQKRACALSVDADVAQVADPHPGPEKNLATHRLVGAVRRLINELPEPQAEALTLHTVLGFTVHEIAEAIEVPEETVRSRLKLARRALARRVAAHPELREIRGSKV